MVVDLQEDSLVVMEALTNKDAIAVSVTACLGALYPIQVCGINSSEEWCATPEEQKGFVGESELCWLQWS